MKARNKKENEIITFSWIDKEIAQIKFKIEILRDLLSDKTDLGKLDDLERRLQEVESKRRSHL
jgi:hypothetical protein